MILCNANCHLLIDKLSIKVHYLIAYNTYTCALNPWYYVIPICDLIFDDCSIRVYCTIIMIYYIQYKYCDVGNTAEG